jgi:hypothetical protein
MVIKGPGSPGKPGGRSKGGDYPVKGREGAAA